MNSSLCTAMDALEAGETKASIGYATGIVAGPDTIVWTHSGYDFNDGGELVSPASFAAILKKVEAPVPDEAETVGKKVRYAA